MLCQEYMEYTDRYASGRNIGNVPTVPLPNPGEGGPVADLGDTGAEPVIPLPNPGEGGPVAELPGADTPVVPLPNPGEGRPIVTGGAVVLPVWPRNAKVRFLNAAYGYPSFRIFFNRRRAVNFLGYASLSGYGRYSSGYHTVTVTGADGYVYLQKTLPFESGGTSTVAVINRAGGLDLIQIPDTCCAPASGASNFRVSNLAYNSGPVDVLLADGRVIYADVRFKETTAYKRIQPGEYEFLFAETNLMPIPSDMDIESLDSAFIGMYPVPDMVASLYLNVQRNRNYTVFLLQNGPGANSVQTLTAEDR